MTASARPFLGIVTAVVALEALAVIAVALLGLANDARDGAAWVTPGLAVSALVVLACLLAPPVTRALSANESV